MPLFPDGDDDRSFLYSETSEYWLILAFLLGEALVNRFLGFT